MSTYHANADVMNIRAHIAHLERNAHAAAVYNLRAVVVALEQMAAGKHIAKEVLRTLAFDGRDALAYLLELPS